jgi:hypothetical protein
LSNFEEFAKLKFAALKSRSVVSSLASFCVIDLFAQGFWFCDFCDHECFDFRTCFSFRWSIFDQYVRAISIQMLITTQVFLAELIRFSLIRWVALIWWIALQRAKAEWLVMLLLARARVVRRWFRKFSSKSFRIGGSLFRLILSSSILVYIVLTTCQDHFRKPPTAP